jgi:hypothetical protein
MRKHRIAGLVAALLALALALALSSSRSAQEEAMADRGPLVGGVTDVPQNDNDIHLQELARFAVDEHNKKAVRTTPPPPRVSYTLLFDA